MPTSESVNESAASTEPSRNSYPSPCATLGASCAGSKKSGAGKTARWPLGLPPGTQVEDDIPLEGAIFCHVFVLNSVLERTGNRVTEAHNLTMPQWMALGCIRHAPEEGVTHSELGQRLMLSKAPITGVVDRLERAGFVTRTTSASDRRVSCIRITEAGALVWSQVRDTMRAQATEICECLGEEGKETLLELLSRLLEQVAAADPMLEAMRASNERRQVLGPAPGAKGSACSD